jgi:BirA family biotin operon repressor/biotin-[acetyl-CoA-carboxylase] ligase
VKHEVLRALREERGRFVSGERLSSLLGISRTAVWKHVTALRRDGYTIIGQPRSGYALVAAPDKLLPEVVRAGLNTRVIGSKVRYLATTTSTNDLLKSLAAEGAAEGTVLVAEEQTSGKGRLGRRWECPPGAGLLFSVLLRPRLAPAEVQGLTLLAAVAVAKAIASSLGLRPEIKWPNDVLVGGRKVCGILAEMVAEADQVDFVVIGIGINVNLGTRPLPGAAAGLHTSLDAELGKRVDRAAVLRAVLKELDELYSLFLEGGPESVVSEWASYSATIGKRVTVRGINETFEGTAVAVHGDGALVVKTDDGEIRRFLSGDVTLRPDPPD